MKQLADIAAAMIIFFEEFQQIRKQLARVEINPLSFFLSFSVVLVQSNENLRTRFRGQ